MNGPADARRRWFGLLFLILAGGMTTWGITLLEPRLRGWGFILYWLACFTFLGIAVAIALWDWWIIRRGRRLEQARLAREMVERAAADAEPVKQARREARLRSRSRSRGQGPGPRAAPPPGKSDG
ncbi:MAG: hypothetical protein KDM81_00805 [Verrucomicrobiae bacterium]|nr:hypothetical protein [Verrucomicrobiae bacterium]MCP5523481.1 hypothetical protein [Verrucomicrobiales bacterium]